MKEREGNSTEAVNLYLKAGLPAKAARLAMSREVCLMWTRVILTHPYFPQTVHRFRHICHRAHAILRILKLRVRRGRSFIELQYWTVLDTISRLSLPLACWRRKLGPNSSLKTHCVKMVNDEK